MSTLTPIVWLNLTTVPTLGDSRLALLAQHFEESSQPDDFQLGVSSSLSFSTELWRAIEKVIAYGDRPINAQVASTLRWSEQAGSRLFLLPDADYPSLLRLLPDPPAVLYARGRHELIHQPQIAMVGSRNPSVHGQETARQFARSLGESGFTITSGLAAGIDGSAHAGALGTLGSTIGVLGSGLHVIYPAKHRDLAQKMMENGLLVSEFPPDTQPRSQHFPKRNRIISGLSLGTLVVEASLRSGSLITARNALEQHREVFAIPGSIHNPQARGCHHLIKQGAKLVECTDDILAELPALMGLYRSLNEPWTTVFAAEEFPGQQSQPEPASLGLLSEQAEVVLKGMGYDCTQPDALVERTGLSIAEIRSVLIELELEGWVQEVAGGFIRNAR
ncbi:DNA-processing protein DprA [Hahella aquimaris]|uniref:DNA-processing protein DprA n=1 Tax=Hahella sp. HNIBRBA332 TaxID=3015983 RepID=UPI00273CD012|nr:DNA-processing protein DprA [Hahella sp. HNIBRBA332]WLQ13029.1 DNA-processing protein DprA [Hahella sp. HNIBRBA332]